MNFHFQYFNDGEYPVPETFMVFIMEVVKLIVALVLFRGKFPSFNASALIHSLHFLVPSILYAVNNNIYLVALTMVTPPIWVILCSMRTVITVAMYKFAMKRPVSGAQFVGAFFIVLSIGVAKTPDIVQVLTNSRLTNDHITIL
jgi:hypothetical protein